MAEKVGKWAPKLTFLPVGIRTIFEATLVHLRDWVHLQAHEIISQGDRNRIALNWTEPQFSPNGTSVQSPVAQ
jgi:hypothetical protein